MLLRAHASRRRVAARLGLPALIAACAAVAAGPPALASAAVRYASPTGTAASGACPQAAPCTLASAVSGAAAGDEVTLAPGDYALSKPLRATVAIDLHGTDGQAAPRLLAAAAMDAPFAVGLSGGGSIRHVAISATSDHQAALALNGATGDDLLLSATGRGDASAGLQAAVLLGSPDAAASDTVLRDSVAWSRGPTMAAVVVQHALSGFDAKGSTSTSGTAAPARADLVNVTAIATGAGAAAVKVAHDAAAMSLVDVIARGAAQDLVSATATASVSYSDFRPAASSGFSDAGHDIAAEPQFANVESGDFHELSGSPTVDAGALAPQSGAVDPDANPRTIGAAPDIGAYEFDPTVPSLAGGNPGGPGGDGTAPPTTEGAGPTENLPAPVAHHSFDVEPAQGTVLVRRPGAAGFSVLSAGQQLPLGSTVDASGGVVTLTSARDALGTNQTGRFWGGEFRVTQTAGSQPQTQLSLTGDLSGCPRPSASGHIALAAAARRPRSRLVWGSDNHGHFSTRGANALATVRGTVWMTQDRCDGTLTKVLKGQVTVRNLRSGHSFTVHAGHQRLVRAHR
jgi:hypothetical protein